MKAVAGNIQRRLRLEKSSICQSDPRGFAGAGENPEAFCSSVEKSLFLTSPLMMKACVRVKAEAFGFFRCFPLCSYFRTR